LRGHLQGKCRTRRPWSSFCASLSSQNALRQFTEAFWSRILRKNAGAHDRNVNFV
jgi:hypothetical protein